MWQAEGARRQRDHGDRVAGHVEELDRVAFIWDTGHDVPLHDRPDVAGTEPAYFLTLF